MSDNDSDNRVMCKYGINCYQKNPEHHKKFKHPKRSSVEPSENELKKRKVEIEDNPLNNCRADSDEEESSEIENNKNATEESTKAAEETKSEKVVANLKNIPCDINEKLEYIFLVKMPEDFFSFYKFCQSLDKTKPHNALSAVGIHLVGPFDLINKELKDFTREEGLCHYRYYYDPPEFQTVFTCNDKNLLHYGYFRDEPKEMPVFVACNEANVSCSIEIVGDNLFSAANYHIEKVKKSADPFKKMKIQKIQQGIVEWSKKHNFTLEKISKRMRNRSSKVVTKTFHGAGIVVPYNKKTELGYRELKEDDKSLKKILKSLCESKTEDERKAYWTKLQPVITYASIANDEFDFGTSLELGIDLFCFGDPILHKSILRILPTSYELLGRSQFADILRAHLENRTKGCNVDTITVSE